MGMAAPLYYSADMVRALPDDGSRYETVHGELLVTPAPRAWHQEVLVRLLDGSYPHDDLWHSTPLRGFSVMERSGVLATSGTRLSAIRRLSPEAE
jgi:hypothetical protein